MCARLKMRRRPFARWTRLFLNLILAVVASQNLSRRADAGEKTAAEAFAAARAAKKAVSEKLVSAIGTGEFTVLRQDKEDDAPKLWTKAKVHVYFDQGKYHVQLIYEKRLQQYSKPFRIEDGRDDEVRLIADDEAVYVVNFSKRIQPTGCSGEVFSKKRQQLGFATGGFPLREPARLWMQFPDIDEVITNVGADAIACSDLGEGRFRASYPFGKEATAELDFEKAVGFNVARFRVFNPDRRHEFLVSKATWKEAGDTWYVNEFIMEPDTRDLGKKSEIFSRSLFKYDSFDVNVKVEPDLFTLKSVAIPVGTRFTDRRENAASSFQYWNGTALQAERP